MHVVSPRDGSTSPVYHLTRKGREFVAAHLDDDSFLTKPIEPSQPQHLYHYVAVSETHRLLNSAILKHAGKVELLRWCHEDEPLRPTPDASPVQLRVNFDFPKKTVCIPDAAFVLRAKEINAVFYLEQDRNTYFHDRVAARKAPGYRQLLASRYHMHQFPESSLDFFFVIFIAPDRKRANQLRRSFAKNDADEEIRKVYRFGAFDELTDENLFFQPMFTCCHHGDRVPLIKGTQ